ncbi:hypothetical protein Tco_0993856, partial [Tanacetum coccineum]
RNLGADRVKEARVQTLITEFENLKMSDNDTIDAYAVKLSLCLYHATLERVLDLKTMEFVEVVGRLKAYEERVKEENDSQENARTEYSNGNNNSSRGRGHGSYSRVYVRGRGQGSGCSNTQNHSQRDSSKNREDNEQKCKSLRQAIISSYDSSIRGDFLTMRDSCGDLFKKVSRSANRLYKAQLKVGKEDTNEVGWENVTNQVSSSRDIPKQEDEDSGSDDTPNPLARLETIQLLIALAAGRGIEVSQGKDCVEIKQDRYAMKILKEAGMKDCIVTLCPMKQPRGDLVVKGLASVTLKGVRSKVRFLLAANNSEMAMPTS